MIKLLKLLAFVLAVILFSVPLTVTMADSSPENLAGFTGLGTPSIPIAAGTGMATGGIGLFGGIGVLAPGTISVDVPVGVTVKQVILYWAGVANTTASDPTTIEVNGIPVTGPAIGGPTVIPVGSAIREIV